MNWTGTETAFETKPLQATEQHPMFRASRFVDIEGAAIGIRSGRPLAVYRIGSSGRGEEFRQAGQVGQAIYLGNRLAVILLSFL